MGVGWRRGDFWRRDDEGGGGYCDQKVEHRMLEKIQLRIQEKMKLRMSLRSWRKLRMLTSGWMMRIAVTHSGRREKIDWMGGVYYGWQVGWWTALKAEDLPR